MDKEEPYGQITRSELAPVWDLLRIARLTVEKDFRQPFEIFTDLVKSNDKNGTYRQVIDLLRISKWVTSNTIDYKLSGKRYVTLVYKRKQIGSFVSLKSKPFIFRLDIEDQLLLAELERDLKLDEDLDVFSLVEPVTDESLTGYGQSIFSTEFVNKLNKENSLQILNKLFQVTISHFK
jgi:hypothetical protein